MLAAMALPAFPLIFAGHSAANCDSQRSNLFQHSFRSDSGLGRELPVAASPPFVAAVNLKGHACGRGGVSDRQDLLQDGRRTETKLYTGIEPPQSSVHPIAEPVPVIATRHLPLPCPFETFKRTRSRVLQVRLAAFRLSAQLTSFIVVSCTSLGYQIRTRMVHYM